MTMTTKTAFLDWIRFGSTNDRSIFPGWDQNNDFISDFNQNDNATAANIIPDYDEPFLRYNVDRPEFLFGIDLNNNNWIDRFEDDDLLLSVQARPAGDWRSTHIAVALRFRLRGLPMLGQGYRLTTQAGAALWPHPAKRRGPARQHWSSAERTGMALAALIESDSDRPGVFTTVVVSRPTTRARMRLRRLYHGICERGLRTATGLE